jgi:hypothetical protein
MRRLIAYTLGLVCIAGFSLARNGVLAPAPTPETVQRSNEAQTRTKDVGLFVAPSQLDFGEAYQDQRLQRRIVIENHGEHDIDIHRFVTACSCAAVMPTSLSIPAGEKRTVVLTLDLTSPSPAKGNSATRDFRTFFQPVIRQASGQEILLDGWELTGKIRRVVDLSRWVVDLGNHSELRQPIPSQHIDVTCLVPLRALTAKCVCNDFQVEVAEDQARPSTRKIRITPTGDLSPRIYRFEIQLEVELNTGAVLHPRPILVNGQIVADIQASPPTVSFGVRSLGTTMEDTVTLSSLSSAAFKVVEARSLTPGLSFVCEGQDGKSAYRRFRVIQRCELPGPQTGSGTIVVEKKSGGTSEVPIRIEYYGIALKTRP